MEQLPSKSNKLPALPLRHALETGDTAALTRSITKINIDRIEQQQRDRDRIESELSYLRTKYRQAEDEQQRELITKRGTALKAAIEAMPEFPPLRALAQQNEAATIDEIQLLICWLLDNLNIANGMTPEQIETSAVLILEEYGGLRLEDVAHVLRQALKGAFGIIYNRLDAQTMLQWLGQHADELQQTRHEYQLNEYLRTKDRSDALEFRHRAGDVQAMRDLYTMQPISAADIARAEKDLNK